MTIYANVKPWNYWNVTQSRTTFNYGNDNWVDKNEKEFIFYVCFMCRQIKNDEW